MTKWITYISCLLLLIITTALTIVGTKASFIQQTTVHQPYFKDMTVKEKFSKVFTEYNIIGDSKKESVVHTEPIKPFPVTTEKLPTDLVWEDGMDQPIFADPKNAKKGGVWHEFIMTYPKTFRQIGSNSNGSFRANLEKGDMFLYEYSPKTYKPFASLCKEWAIGKDGKTVYYRLRKEVRWSDGVPSTVDDYIYTLNVMRAENIVDPWYNTYYSDTYDDILKFNDYTMAIRLNFKKPNILAYATIRPMPYHFYGNLQTKEKELEGEQAFATLLRDKKTIPVELEVYRSAKQLKDKLKICTNDKEKGILEKAQEKAKTAVTKFEKTLQKKYKINDQELIAEEALKMCLEQSLDIPSELSGYAEQTKEKKELTVKIAKLEEDKAKNRSELKGLNEELKELKSDISKFEKDGIKLFKVSVLDVCDKWNDRYHWQVAPKLGPYMIDSYMDGKWIKFRRIKTWWAKDSKFYAGRYNPDILKSSVISDLNIAFEHFKLHKLDSFGLTLAKFWHKKANNLPGYDNGYIDKTWFWNNTTRASRLISLNTAVKGLDDKNVRIGINYALNIQKVIDLPMLGDAVAADSITTGYGEFTNDKLKARGFDIDKAIESFLKAGYDKVDSDGIRYKMNGEEKHRLSFGFLYGSPIDKPYILILKEEAAKAGVEFIPETMDTATAFQTMMDKKHDLAWHGWGRGSMISGAQYWGQYHGKNANKKGNNNLSNLNNPELNKLIDFYRNCSDDKKRKKAARDIQAMVHEEACSIPTYYRPFTRSATWKWVIRPESAYLPYVESPLQAWNWWIDTEKKEKLLKEFKSGKIYPKSFINHEEFRQK